MAVLTITERASAALREATAGRRGQLTITIDGGCCEGTAPHLYEDHVLPWGAHCIGELEGVPVYVPVHLKPQYEEARVNIDAVDEPVSDAMSLESRLGVRFVLR